MPMGIGLPRGGGGGGGRGTEFFHSCIHFSFLFFFAFFTLLIPKFLVQLIKTLFNYSSCGHVEN